MAVLSIHRRGQQKHRNKLVPTEPDDFEHATYIDIHVVMHDAIA